MGEREETHKFGDGFEILEDCVGDSSALFTDFMTGSKRRKIAKNRHRVNRPFGWDARPLPSDTGCLYGMQDRFHRIQDRLYGKQDRFHKIQDRLFGKQDR